MPSLVAVAERSNSDNEKCSESFIRIKNFKKNTNNTNLTNRQGDFATTTIELAEAFADVLEGLFGLLQTTGDDAGACDDAAIFTVMHSVAHRDLRAKAWHRTVAGDVAEPLASAAISFQTFAVGTVVRKNDRNETRFLPALMTNYRIGSRTETRFGILCCVADSDAINIEGTINGLTPLGKTFDSNIHILKVISNNY